LPTSAPPAAALNQAGRAASTPDPARSVPDPQRAAVEQSPADEPAEAAPATEAAEEADQDFGDLGFTGVEPEPPAEEPAAVPEVSAAEAREDGAASRSEERVEVPVEEPVEEPPAEEPPTAEEPPAEEPVAPPASGGAEGAIAWAYNHLGLPYQWGSTGPGGYDCSGFTKMAYAAAGVSLPQGSEAQYHSTGRVSLSEIQRGDLLFYSNNGSSSGIYHVAIYLGDGQVIHSLRDWSGGFDGSKTNGMNYSPGLMAAGRP
jgi:cell wall-associated NlpC family hydrolase